MKMKTLTPQQKLINVATKTGNETLKYQQGTTKMIYDSLPLQNGAQVLEFFKDTNARAFPLTNVRNDQLIAGDALAIQRVSFSILVLNPDGDIVETYPLDAFTSNGSGFEALRFATMEMRIANQNVMNPIRLLHVLPEFNKTAYNEKANVFEFAIDLGLMPQLDFSFTVKTAEIALPVSENTIYLSATIEGAGAQIDLKTTY